MDGFKKMGDALRRIFFGYDEDKHESDKKAKEAVEKVTGRKIDREVVDGEGSGLIGKPIAEIKDSLLPNMPAAGDNFLAIAAALLLILLLKD